MSLERKAQTLANIVMGAVVDAEEEHERQEEAEKQAAKEEKTANGGESANEVGGGEPPSDRNATASALKDDDDYMKYGETSKYYRRSFDAFDEIEKYEKERQYLFDGCREATVKLRDTYLAYMNQNKDNSADMKADLQRLIRRCNSPSFNTVELHKMLIQDRPDLVLNHRGGFSSKEIDAARERAKAIIAESKNQEGFVMHIMIKKSVADEICRYWGFPLVIRKANPHHDARGRFTFGAGSLDVGTCVKDQHGVEHTIQRKIKTQGDNFVFIAYQKHTNEEDDNLAACEILTDKLGWTCVLLPRSNELGVKTADMLKTGDKTYWEIKTNRSGSVSSLDNELRSAKNQSKNVIVRFDMTCIKKLNQEGLKRAGKRRVEREGLTGLIFIINGKHGEAKVVWI